MSRGRVRFFFTNTKRQKQMLQFSSPEILPWSWHCSNNILFLKKKHQKLIYLLKWRQKLYWSISKNFWKLRHYRVDNTEYITL